LCPSHVALAGVTSWEVAPYIGFNFYNLAHQNIPDGHCCLRQAGPGTAEDQTPPSANGSNFDERSEILTIFSFPITQLEKTTARLQATA